MNNIRESEIDLWLTGIYSELEFWNEYIRNQGGIFKKKWGLTTDPNRKFVLEEDIPQDKNGKAFYFLDVGSGPFSRCGFVTDRVILKHTAIDPLAAAYKMMKEKEGINTRVNLKEGFVEILDCFVEKNSFDLVHMSNSLDHSFDPIIGVFQLLNACKIGGKVILRHKQNEAETEKYEGFHQWNLSVNVNNNRFVIWRGSEIYVINDLIEEYAEIRCSVDALEPIFNRVELIKKKDIVIPENNYYDVLLKRFYSFLINTIYNDVLAGVNSPKDVYLNKMVEKINSISNEELVTIFIKRNVKKVSIYGMGVIGKKILERMSDTEIEVLSIIDNYDLEVFGKKTCRLNEDDNILNADLVLLTPFNGIDKLRREVINKGVDAERIITISELLESAS